MGWKDGQKYSILVAKVDKVGREMAAVAVEDQKSPSATCFCFRSALEDLMKPGKSYLII